MTHFFDRPLVKKALPWLLVFLLGVSFSFFLFVLLTHDYHWSRVGKYWGNLVRGWGLTIGLSAVALLLSTLFAAILTAGQLSRLAPARWLSRCYVEVIRGTPLLVQIMIGSYMMANALGIDNKLGEGMVILSAFSAAYLSEIFRAGIESIPLSQRISAMAVGFTPTQTYRYVIIPQTIRRILPATAGQFANLVKDSSLLYVIGLPEFTSQAREVHSNSYAGFAVYLPLAIGYLILTIPISLWTRRMEERFRYEH